MPCWYYDKEGLQKTPSIQDGIDYNTECRYRKQGARFITEIGTQMELGYNTMATAVVYYHRFYMFHSFKTFPRYVTACCCLFLAGKVEETPKKCKDIIKVAESLLSKNIFSTFGEDPKEEVMTLEKILLQTIKFDLKVQHPYNYLLRYAKGLKGDKHKLQKMVQMAWTFINDSLCTTLSIQWEPEIIAIAVMYLAGKLTKFNVITWGGRKPHHTMWWDAHVQDLKMNVVEDICHQVLDLYSTVEATVSPTKKSKKKLRSEQLSKSKEESTTNVVSSSSSNELKIDSVVSQCSQISKDKLLSAPQIGSTIEAGLVSSLSEPKFGCTVFPHLSTLKTEICTPPESELKIEHGATPPLLQPKVEFETMPSVVQPKIDAIPPVPDLKIGFEVMPSLPDSRLDVNPVPISRDPRVEVAATISPRDPRIETAIALATAQAIPWAPMMMLPKTPSSLTPDSLYSPSKPLPNFPAPPEHFSFSNRFIESTNNHSFINSPTMGSQSFNNSFVAASTMDKSKGFNNFNNSMADSRNSFNNWDNFMADRKKRFNNRDYSIMDCNESFNNSQNRLTNNNNDSYKYDKSLTNNNIVDEEDWDNDNPATDDNQNLKKCDNSLTDNTSNNAGLENNSLSDEIKDFTNSVTSNKIKGNWNNPLTQNENSDFPSDLKCSKGFDDSDNGGRGFGDFNGSPGFNDFKNGNRGFRNFNNGRRGFGDFDNRNRGFGNFDKRGRGFGNFNNDGECCNNCGFKQRRSFGYPGNRRRNNFFNKQNDRFDMDRDLENSNGKFQRDNDRDDFRRNRHGPIRNQRRFNS